MRLFRVGGGLLLLLLGCARAAQAAPADVGPVQDQSASPDASPVQAAEPSQYSGAPSPDASMKWQFATIGYVWFAGAKGETDVIGPAEPVGLDLSFGDVLDAFKFAFMGAAEARRNRLIILSDLTFIHLDTRKGIDIREQDFLEAELDSRTMEITLLGGYRVADKGPVVVDLLGGARANFFKTSLQLDGPNRSEEGSVKQTWFDPLIATRVTVPLGHEWQLSLYGDVGGIITGSDISWQMFGTVDYDINRKMKLGAGWRYFKVDYDNGDFLYDVAQSGPVITFRTVF